jgi:hypothetical protein
MLKLGWIRLSEYVTPTGQLASLTELPGGSLGFDPGWSAVPATGFDPSFLAPEAAEEPTRLRTAPPPLPLPLPAPVAVADDDLLEELDAEEAAAAHPEVEAAEDEEAIWQAALARAKAQEKSDAETHAAGAATMLDTPTIAAREDDADNDSEDAQEQEAADWEEILARAKQRADVESDVKAAAEEDAAAKSEPAVAEPAVATAKNGNLDQDWDNVLHQARSRERDAANKKLRAMREAQRLQTRSGLKDFAKPAHRPPDLQALSRRRLAAGTEPPPSRFDTARGPAAVVKPPRAPKAEKSEQPRLPRITTRAGVGAGS